MPAAVLGCFRQLTREPQTALCILTTGLEPIQGTMVEFVRRMIEAEIPEQLRPDLPVEHMAYLRVIPAVIPRPFVSWIVSATMLCAAVVGFFTAFSSDMPSLLSMVGSLPAAVLALVLAAVHQGIALRNRGAIARARSGVRDTQPSE